MRKQLIGLAVTAALAVSATPVLANCDPGEIVIKFSHVTNTDKHPKVSQHPCWKSGSMRR